MTIEYKTAKDQRIFVAITGASGSIYAQSLVEELLNKVGRIYLCMSETAKKVMIHELDHVPVGKFCLRRVLTGKLNDKEKKILRTFEAHDYFSPIASGSSVPDQMVVLPCSMGSLARIVSGISSSLIERSADVILKQKKKLIICPRETPLNKIHLKNMLELSDLGAHIIPAMPAFYQKPQSISDLVDFMTGRILEALDLQHDLYKPWNSNRI